MTTTQIYTDTRTLVLYWRRLPDGRLLFGGRAGLTSTASALRLRRAWLEARMVEKFPDLSGIGSEYFWHGNVCLPYDRTPHVHAVKDEPTVIYAMGYAGTGVAMATYCGGSRQTWQSDEGFHATHPDLRRTSSLPAGGVAPSLSGRGLRGLCRQGPVALTCKYHWQVKGIGPPEWNPYEKLRRSTF